MSEIEYYIIKILLPTILRSTVEHLLMAMSFNISTYACRAAAMLAFPLFLPNQSGGAEDVDASIRLFPCLAWILF